MKKPSSVSGDLPVLTDSSTAPFPASPESRFASPAVYRRAPYSGPPLRCRLGPRCSTLMETRRRREPRRQPDVDDHVAGDLLDSVVVIAPLRTRDASDSRQRAASFGVPRWATARCSCRVTATAGRDQRASRLLRPAPGRPPGSSPTCALGPAIRRIVAAWRAAASGRRCFQGCQGPPTRPSRFRLITRQVSSTNLWPR